MRLGCATYGIEKSQKKINDKLKKAINKDGFLFAFVRLYFARILIFLIVA